MFTGGTIIAFMIVLTTKRPWPNELSLKKHFIKIVQKSVAFSVYEIVFQSNMITKLDEIYDYIAKELSAPITAKKKIKEIRDNISILKMFPEAGFDADEKLGKVIDSNNKRREITLKKRLYCFIFYWW